MNEDIIERLKKRLYRKGETFRERKLKSPLTPYTSEPKTYWEGSLSEEEHLPLPEKPRKTPARKAIIIAGIIFSLAILGFLLYSLLLGPNVVSSKNIEISFNGPTTIKGGDAGDWQVSITNNNKTGIELADLIIEYPENSEPIAGFLSGAKTLYERRAIGQIKAGETVIQPVKAYLFGEKDSVKVFKLTLEYRPQGSNAILAKTAENSVRLLQSPVEVSVNMPTETNAGESFLFDVEIISNAAAVIKNTTLKIEYPAGFQYQDSDLKPASGDDIWRLGDLEPNKKRVINITGILEGQDQMELSFRVLAGPVDEKGEVIAYGFATQGITLKKSFLKLGILVDGKTGDVIASEGANLKVEIEWQNTLPDKIYNAVIQAKITGPSVNQRTISVGKGFYRSFDQTLVWNQSSEPGLAEIEPLQSDKEDFNFSIFGPLPNDVIKTSKPTVTLEIEMSGERITEGEGRVEIKNHLTKEIKIATLLKLSRRGLYHSGPFTNTGPLPPKVGKETTYTIIWSLTNSANAVSDATVSAFLPSYIRWLGMTKPENTDVSYNQTTGEVVWRPGTVVPGAGIVTSAQELAFQISFLPSATQIGGQPVLVSETTVNGKDSFTGAFLRDMKSALTTYLDTDPQFKYGEAAVKQ